MPTPPLSFQGRLLHASFVIVGYIPVHEERTIVVRGSLASSGILRPVTTSARERSCLPGGSPGGAGPGPTSSHERFARTSRRGLVRADCQCGRFALRPASRCTAQESWAPGGRVESCWRSSLDRCQNEAALGPHESASQSSGATAACKIEHRTQPKPYTQPGRANVRSARRSQAKRMEGRTLRRRAAGPEDGSRHVTIDGDRQIRAAVCNTFESQPLFQKKCFLPKNPALKVRQG